MKNDDFISRSALIAEYDRVHVGPPGGARKLMEEAPAVDAVPVVHGYWVRRIEYDDGFGYVPVFSCSHCGYTEHPYGNYCIRCGAKMDGDAE